MNRRKSLAGALAAALLLGPAGSALAQNNLYNDYKRDGQVNPCSYSPSEVRKNLRDLPPDVQQYAPGLADQLRRPCSRSGSSPPSTSAQHGGASSSGSATGGGSSPSAGGAGDPNAALPSPPAPSSPAVPSVNATAPTLPASSGGSLPAWLVVALAALAALGLAAVIAGRYGGLRLEGLTRPLRASLAEAGGRAGDRVGGVRDRFRFRR